MKNKCVIIVFLIGLLLIFGGVLFVVIKSNKKDDDISQIELKTHILTKKNDKISAFFAEEKGILKTYDDYKNLIKKFDLNSEENTFLEEKYFDDVIYVYHVLNINPCSEKITYKDIVVKDSVATLYYDVERKCGVCASEIIIYMEPIKKTDSVTNVEVEYNYSDSISCDVNVAYKPILYLYPKEDTIISIELKNESQIITSYPKYSNGWKVLAKPNGDLYDKENKYYYALYWDEYNNTDVTFEEGFYVSKDRAIQFLEEKLFILGLNAKEKNEFIMYWLPILEKNEHSLVYFELTDERQINNELIINPKPDSLLRVNMHIKKVDEKIKIKEQDLENFERKGFVAVEWGGTIH